jgi:hypothetical protein
MAGDADELLPNPTVVSQTTKDGAVLLEMSTGECFELNHVGAEIWAAFAKGDKLVNVVASLASRYGRPAGEIDADVQALIADLREKGLLRQR